LLSRANTGEYCRHYYHVFCNLRSTRETHVTPENLLRTSFQMTDMTIVAKLTPV
jgi:hypothetical protein